MRYHRGKLFIIHEFRGHLLAIFWVMAMVPATVSFGQESRVLVEPLEANPQIIQVKWYTDALLYPEGVNLYRRESGSTTWQRLSDRPIAKDEALGDQLMEADTAEIPFVAIPRQESMGDIRQTVFFLYLLVRSFDSNEYARHLGIYYQDSSAEDGKTYSYRVMRLSGGRETILGQSDPITVGAPSDRLPVAGVKTQQEGKSILLDWDVDEDRFYAVNIYRSSSDSIGRRKLTVRPIMLSEVEDSLGQSAYPSPKYIDLNVVEGVEYSYEIEGLGYFGRPLPPSEPISVLLSDVTPPPAPSDFEVELDSFNIRFQWQNPEGPDIREIQLKRSRNSEGPYEEIFTTLEQSSYESPVFEPGPYYFHVASVDHSGNEAVSQTRFVDIPDQTPPSPPASLTIVADTGRFQLGWQPNTEVDLLGYQVFRTIEGAGPEHFVLLTGDPITGTTFEQELPKNIQNKFLYYVIAVDSALNRSAPSNKVKARMPDALPPEQPNIVQINYVEEGVQLVIRPNIDPDLLGYEVYRSDSIAPLSFQKIGDKLQSREATSFVDDAGKAGKAYLYHLVALDSAGNRSIPSEPVLASLPEIPQGLEVRASLRYKKRKAENVLSWRALVGDWLGYVIYKGEEELPMKPATGLLQATEFIDKEPGSSARYQVRAYNQNGEIIKSEIIQWKR